MSDVAWIVGSLKERDAALELMEYGGDADPRDELGVGYLRDVLGEAFFPGVTTLQTRAKYFLLVPQMYRAIESRRRRRKTVDTQINDLERDVLVRLRGTTDTSGVIGSRRWVVPGTPASAIYWTGLRTWRIRNFSDPRPRYHRWLDSGAQHAHLGLSEEDADEPVLWHEFVDSYDGLSKPSMSLTSDEAAFLRTRILAIKDKPKRSLLKDYVSAPSATQAEFLWEVPMVVDGTAALSDEALDARMLSAALHGAMLTYNYLCARARGGWTEDWAERSRDWWREHPQETWASWDLKAFWSRTTALPLGQRAEQRTRSFVDGWVGELRRKTGSMPAERRGACQMIEARERLIKRHRARLSGGPALKDWDGRVGVAAEPMPFRWKHAARILNDIHMPEDG